MVKYGKSYCIEGTTPIVESFVHHLLGEHEREFGMDLTTVEIKWKPVPGAKGLWEIYTEDLK